MRISRIVLIIDKAHAVGDFDLNLLSAAVHDLGHARSCYSHEILPESLAVDVQEDWDLIMSDMGYDLTLVAETQKCDIEGEEFDFFNRWWAWSRAAAMQVE